MAAKVKSTAPKKFEAAIYRVGILYCIDVPAALSKTLGGETHIPVTGTVNGVTMRGQLVPRGDGEHRLFLDGKVRKAARVGQGQVVTLVLGPDRESREVPIPEDVLEAFEDEPGVLEKFQGLTMSQRREVLLWILKAKHVETRAKRVANIVLALATGRLGKR
jgi:Bacteriocin-protection, YdeI or OmpD-Associated/Domain of unknown function (DUF1905)